MSPLVPHSNPARLRVGISQMQLGVDAGMDEYSASAPINQHERGKHRPDVRMVRRPARVLGVPAACFCVKTDEKAQRVVGFHRPGATQRKQVLRLVEVRLRGPWDMHCACCRRGPTVGGMP